MKNLTHTIRDLLEGKAVVDPNKEDLAKLKAVAKVKDEKEVEEKLDEVLEYGTQQAANQYAKDTPGQTPGHEPNPVQHQHKPNLAVDGVPVPGGQIKKPNFDKDAGMGKVTAKEEVEVDEGFGDMVNKVKEKIKKAAADVKNFKHTDTAAQIRKNKTTSGVSMSEEGRWDETQAGREYRSLSPEEKHRLKLKKDVLKKSKELKGKKEYAKEHVVNEILDNLIEKYNLQEAMSQAQKDAMRDAAKEYGKPKVDPADIDHDHKPEPKKRGRGERDLPHITTQLRGVVDMGDKHSGVKFKDGKTVKVHPDHAKSWLAKHDSAKPAHKLAMYKSHDSHSEFMKHK